MNADLRLFGRERHFSTWLDPYVACYSATLMYIATKDSLTAAVSIVMSDFVVFGCELFAAIFRGPDERC